MKLFRFFAIGLLLVLTISLRPVIADADSVSWTSEYYRAYANSADISIDEDTGPPFPVEAFSRCCTSGGHDSWAEADITTSAMHAAGSAITSLSYTNLPTNAIAEFDGYYTADNPYFLFSYSYSTFLIGSEPEINSVFSLEVIDMTTSSPLLSQIFQDGSAVISIPTVVGHDINVHMVLDVNVDPYANYMQLYSDVDYSMSTVVPEPISSILFVTGGTLLAGTAFLQKKEIYLTTK